MDNENKFHTMMQDTDALVNENEVGKYGTITKDCVQDGIHGEEGKQNERRPICEKERNVMLMIMGMVYLLCNIQIFMIGPFYPQYVSIISYLLISFFCVIPAQLVIMHKQFLLHNC